MPLKMMLTIPFMTNPDPVLRGGTVILVLCAIREGSHRSPAFAVRPVTETARQTSGALLIVLKSQIGTPEILRVE